MSKGAKGTAGQAPVESNAENSRQERIAAALSKRLSRLVLTRFGLGMPVGALLLPPDFSDLPTHRSYRELAAKIKLLGELIESAEAGMQSLFELNELGGFSDLEAVSSVRKHEGLTLVNVARLNGLCMSSAKLLLELYTSAALTKISLEAEKRTRFPRGKGRKINIYPHLIAERLAQFWLTQLREKPTYGTDNYGHSYPSTAFQGALMDIFDILEIKHGTSGPAKVACKAITDGDVNKVRRAFDRLRDYSKTSAD